MKFRGANASHTKQTSEICWSLWRRISLSLSIFRTGIGNFMKFHNETGQQRTLPVQEHEAPRRRQLPAPTYSEWTQIRICMDMQVWRNRHLVETPMLAAGTSWQSKAWGVLMADSGDCISKLEKSRERWNTPCLILERQFLLVNGLPGFRRNWDCRRSTMFLLDDGVFLASFIFLQTHWVFPISDRNLLFKTWQNLHRETVEASLKPQLTSEKTLVTSRYPGWFLDILITA